MDSCQPFSLGAFILAAGRSRRMGRPKLLLPWAHTSILGHLVNLWNELGAKAVCVVLAADDQALADELDRLALPWVERILNPTPGAGMFVSIQHAAHWAAPRTDLTHCAIVLGDQPHLRPATLRKLLNSAAETPLRVCQPSYAARARHPVIFPQPIFGELAASKADTLKAALSEQNVSLVECDDPGLDLDLDTPEDYRKAIALGSPV